MSDTAAKYCGKRKATETSLLTPAGPFTSIHARQNLCPWCLHDEFVPGSRWGLRCTTCNTNISTTSKDTGYTPLPCLACNHDLVRDTPYLRLMDPAGGTTKKGSPVFRYLHADGTTCIPSAAHTASVHRCHGCDADGELFDASGDDSAAFISCRECFHKDRAALIGDVRTFLVASKTKATECVPSPKKPAPIP